MNGRFALVIVLAVLGIVMMSDCIARAHDVANWIQADPLTRHCCGEHDCERVTGRVLQNGDASWSVLGWTGSLMLGNRGLYFHTPDKQPWACRNLANNTLRCLFLPLPEA